MAQRVFLHLGTAKSGTTYLQELWWRHRDALKERGLLLPGKNVIEHFQAAAVIKGMTKVTVGFNEHQLATWPRLLAEAAKWDGDVLISHEHFSDATAEPAAEAMAQLAEVADEVHVLVTARDLARVIPSAWQQRVKQGARQPYATFVGNVRNAADFRFEHFQDIPRILDRWAPHLPPERVHIVVLPGAGAARDELWLRTNAVLGVDVSGLETESRLPNESLNLVEAELLRRVNKAVPDEERTVELARIAKGFFARRVLAGSADREGLVLPEADLDWVVARSEAVVATLAERGYDVTGNLRDLVPTSVKPGRTPDDATDGELLAAATKVIAALLVHERHRPRHRPAAPAALPHSPTLRERLRGRRR